jgi:hypothetical protein
LVPGPERVKETLAPKSMMNDIVRHYTETLSESLPRSRRPSSRVRRY